MNVHSPIPFLILKLVREKLFCKRKIIGSDKAYAKLSLFKEPNEYTFAHSVSFGELENIRFEIKLKGK